MTVNVTPVFLLDATTRRPVEAKLRDAIQEQQLLDWQFHWRPALREYLRRLVEAKVPQSQWPESWHWDWQDKLAEVKGLLSHQAFCILCQNVTQAMMRLDVAGKRGRLDGQKGQHLVYIDYLEVAPWNWEEAYADPPRYRGAGSILLRGAVEASREEGFKGRVALHSLPQAVPFYERCGMTNLGPDPSYPSRLPYFEMTPEQADLFLKKGTRQ